MNIHQYAQHIRESQYKVPTLYELACKAVPTSHETRVDWRGDPIPWPMKDVVLVLERRLIQDWDSRFLPLPPRYGPFEWRVVYSQRPEPDYRAYHPFDNPNRAFIRYVADHHGTDVNGGQSFPIEEVIQIIEAFNELATPGLAMESQWIHQGDMAQKPRLMRFFPPEWLEERPDCPATDAYIRTRLGRMHLQEAADQNNRARMATRAIQQPQEQKEGE